MKDGHCYHNKFVSDSHEVVIAYIMCEIVLNYIFVVFLLFFSFYCFRAFVILSTVSLAVKKLF